MRPPRWRTTVNDDLCAAGVTSRRREDGTGGMSFDRGHGRDSVGIVRSSELDHGPRRAPACLGRLEQGPRRTCPEARDQLAPMRGLRDRTWRGGPGARPGPRARLASFTRTASPSFNVFQKRPDSTSIRVKAVRGVSQW